MQSCSFIILRTEFLFEKKGEERRSSRAQYLMARKLPRQPLSSEEGRKQWSFDNYLKWFSFKRGCKKSHLTFFIRLITLVLCFYDAGRPAALAARGGAAAQRFFFSLPFWREKAFYPLPPPLPALNPPHLESVTRFIFKFTDLSFFTR